MKKKLLALLAAGAMLLGLVGCSSTPATPSATPAEGGDAAATGETVKIGVSIYKFDDNFMTLYRNEIQNYVDELNKTSDVKYEVTIQDGKGDQAEQTNQIDNFITQDFDVLIINLVQSTSAATVIEKCKEANKPCIFINREPSAEDMTMYENADGTAADPYATMYTYVGADARQSGKFQGQLIADLENKGDLNGDGVLQYVMVVGDPENVDAQYRTQFSIEEFQTASGLKVEKLDEQRGDWDQAKGQEIVANALTKYGDKVEVVFCNNDAMALGAAQAIEAAGRKVGEDIYLVGVDALAEAVELVSTGGMTGTVLNDHIGQSHSAVDAAIKATKGEELDSYYWVDYVKVTPENAAEFK
ncbi:galactose ABC transporter substrate-binding protein [Anaerorhabdus sp.]|uniref:galactose ABC transporter substrate-binding protein n=1 Tax=Anaerorhabdus sp. TaxID=1872524 RepID=UPI002FC7A021